MMDSFSSELIRPLKKAERYFLEVLLSEFSLKRTRTGVDLDVHFDQNTLTIWCREAKTELLKKIENFEKKARSYQNELDDFLLHGIGEQYHFNDKGFPFRYASGGTLPIVRIDKRDYYCLFYREIFPIGWNIANGGCDTREELLNPLITIERELREELLILDLKKKKRFVFDCDTEKPIDHPEFALARRIWAEVFGLSYSDILKFEEITIPVKWLKGRDSLTIYFENKSPIKIEGCFLNINAEDFGIEIDKIAKVTLSGDAQLCDGEVQQDYLVRAPIGLFDVDRLNESILSGSEELIPDFIHFDGKEYKGRELENKVAAFIQYIKEKLSKDDIRMWDKSTKRYDLCPVTRRIIERYLLFCTKSSEVSVSIPEVGKYPIFICFGGDDKKIARKVYDYFLQKGKIVFFSEESYNVDYSRMIDKALDKADWLIAVATNPQNLLRPWPEFEWRTFHLNIHCGINPSGRMAPFITGFNAPMLPGPLRYFKAIEFDLRDINKGLENLSKHIFSLQNKPR